jgi:hypothetical protein
MRGDGFDNEVLADDESYIITVVPSGRLVWVEHIHVKIIRY